MNKRDAIARDCSSLCRRTCYLVHLKDGLKVGGVRERGLLTHEKLERVTVDRPSKRIESDSVIGRGAVNDPRDFRQGGSVARVLVRHVGEIDKQEAADELGAVEPKVESASAL